jgi:hypothetical protein
MSKYKMTIGLHKILGAEWSGCYCVTADSRADPQPASLCETAADSFLQAVAGEVDRT